MFTNQGRLLYLIAIGQTLILVTLVVAAYKLAAKGVFVPDAFAFLALIDILGLAALGVAVAVRR